MISTTLLLRRSGQFSLNVRPSTLTTPPFNEPRVLIMVFTVCSPMYLPMPSLMRRPDKITSG